MHHGLKRNNERSFGVLACIVKCFVAMQGLVVFKLMQSSKCINVFVVGEVVGE
jgi:hypothetical protein